MHIEALEKMGASFELDHGVLIGKTDGLKGVEINLPMHLLVQLKIHF